MQRVSWTRGEIIMKIFITCSLGKIFVEPRISKKY